jgi:tetratricopeptide (TPR) repeat protein
VKEPAVEIASAKVAAEPAQRGHFQPVGFIAISILLIAVAAGWLLWRQRRPAAKPVLPLAALPLESLSGELNQNPAAREAYLRGRYFLSKREAGKSTAYFEQAVSLDPSSASAYAGLSDSLESQTLMGMARPEDAMPKALAAAKRAIALDSQNGEAYAALGSIETTYEWDWAAAEHKLTRAIALSPAYPLAEMRYTVFLDAMNRTGEAITHMRRALQLDPLSFLMNRHMGSTLFFARHYDEALYHLRRAGEMEPQSTVVENWISWTYEKKGMQDEAVSHDLASLRTDLPQAQLERLRSLYQAGRLEGILVEAHRFDVSRRTARLHGLRRGNKLPPPGKPGSGISLAKSGDRPALLLDDLAESKSCAGRPPIRPAICRVTWADEPPRIIRSQWRSESGTELKKMFFLWIGITAIRPSKPINLFLVRLNVNAVFSPFDSSTQTLPPCSSAIRRAKVSPRPVPLGFPAVTNGSNNVFRIDAGMPGPLSRMVMWIHSSTSAS